MFELYYAKNKNEKLFNYLEQQDSYSNMQNYIPIYSMLFNLNNTNWNSINLNNPYNIQNIVEKHDDNNYTIEIAINETRKIAPTFVKLAPLIDPVMYITGKYSDLSNNLIMELPQHFYNKDELRNHNKSYRLTKKYTPHNSSYIDAFFSYLTSNINHSHDFIHGIHFYGSFVGLKHNFNVNIADEIEYVQESDHFYKYNNKDFTIDKDVAHEVMNYGTRKYKQRLSLQSIISNVTLDNINDLELSEIFTDNINDSNIIQQDVKQEILQTLIYENNMIDDKNSNANTNRSTTSSSCSSRYSETTASYSSLLHKGESNDDVDEFDNLSEVVSSTDNSDDECDDNSSIHSVETGDINISIHKFPVNIICLEKMEATLDDYMMNNEISNNEWKSIFLQIIMQLIAYQRMFDFTHNDLHTNNVMYIPTEKKHIIYSIDSKYYKVPTYGKIYKLIDFGRAIYRFKGKRYCSDSYNKHGDAHTQYNCEPFYNSNKPRIEPNKAFDLCRLGCSLYDFFEEDIEMNEFIDEKNEIAELVKTWCTDDKDTNILYKKDGRDRYPGFKLYKMIARSVHKHTPVSQLDNPIFDVFKTTRKKINKRAKIIAINKLPVYT